MSAPEPVVAGAGAPVLLVMGLGMAGELWSPMLPGLSAGARVATFDHRGLGRHADRPPARSMRELAEDVAGVLDRLGWPSAHLVGVSMGGMAVQELAVRRPERVRSLTLLATTARGRAVLLPDPGLLRAVLGARSREDRLARMLFPAEIRASRAEEVRERAARMAAAMAPRSTIRAQFLAVLGHDTRSRLGSVGAPALVVKPARDVMIRPSASDELARRLPRARLVVLPDAGHGLVAQSAGELARLILEHVAAAEARSG